MCGRVGGWQGVLYYFPSDPLESVPLNRIATTKSALPSNAANTPAEELESTEKFVCFWNGRLISQTRLSGLKYARRGRTGGRACGGRAVGGRGEAEGRGVGGRRVVV